MRCKTLSLLFVPRLDRGMEIFMNKKGYVGFISALMVVILLQVNNVITNVIGIIIFCLSIIINSIIIYEEFSKAKKKC